MAIYKAIANGDWSNLAIWQDNSSGFFAASTVLPSTLDTVYSNNFIVEMDTDVSVLELSAYVNSGLGIAAGGYFNVTTNRTITCSYRIFGSGVAASSTVLIQGTSLSVIINANIASSPAPNSTRALIIQGSSHNLIVNGNVIGNTAAASITSIFIASTNSSITINGNISGGYTNSQVVYISSVGGNILNVYGNISPGGQTNTTAIYTTSTGVNTINIYGNITNTIVNTGVIFTQGTNIVNIIGTIETSTVNQAIKTTTCNFSGYIKVINSNFPIQAFPLNISPSSYIEISENAGATNNFAVLSSIPSQSDVRQGVNYTAGNTGTLIVPDPSNVRKDVPTDDTVGTADLSAADMWDYLTSNVSTSGSIGEAILDIKTKTDTIPTNPASVDAVGAIVASYNV